MAVQSSFKNMLVCLSSICLVCSALLAGVYSLTAEPIAAAQKAKTTNAIAQVVPAFDSLSELKATEVESVQYPYYEAYDQDGKIVGFAIQSTTSGFGGQLSLMVGLDADGNICSTTVLSHSETPGLGAKCTDSAFSDQFKGWNPRAELLKVSKDGGVVDAITASTITSRAYAKAVSNAFVAYTQIMNTKGGENNE